VQSLAFGIGPGGQQQAADGNWSLAAGQEAFDAYAYWGGEYNEQGQYGVYDEAGNWFAYDEYGQYDETGQFYFYDEYLQPPAEQQAAQQAGGEEGAQQAGQEQAQQPQAQAQQPQVQQVQQQQQAGGGDSEVDDCSVGISLDKLPEELRPKLSGEGGRRVGRLTGVQGLGRSRHARWHMPCRLQHMCLPGLCGCCHDRAVVA
jgi:hypothetical protein